PPNPLPCEGRGSRHFSPFPRREGGWGVRSKQYPFAHLRRPHNRMPDIDDTPPESESSGWFNRTVLGAGVTSFLGDLGYETATAILPAFLRTLHLPPDAVGFVLGVIEGVADLLANAIRLLVGWYSDRIGHRKRFVVSGYALTGSAFALCALALS